MDFATIFNTGKHPHDKRYLSTFISTPEGFSVTKSMNPVTLRDFYITVEQCGLAPPRDATADAQAYVFQEYTTNMAMRTKRWRDAFQERDNKRRDAYLGHGNKRRFGSDTNSGPRRAKKQQYDNAFIDLDDDRSEYTFGSFGGPSQASTSQVLSKATTGTELPVNATTYYDPEPNAAIAGFIESVTSLSGQSKTEDVALHPAEEMQE